MQFVKSGVGKKQNIGIVDQAVNRVEDDYFKISKYTDGLSKFILQCETPMTIAIQGDWGSGKTSFMNLINNTLTEGNIDGSVETIWFNTWAFSQFNMGDMLPINLMAMLLSTLHVEDDEKEVDLKHSILKLAGAAAMFASDIALNQLGTEVRISDLLHGNEDKGEESLFDTIKNLRETFENRVSIYLQKREKNKLVLFVDDLDRLPPERAVEVLEILKLFLDCDKCVFVLAIDYGVVCRGIRKKYGEDMDEKKGRSFFDKIIQVPFKMPVEQYEIATFLENSTVFLDEDRECLTEYADLLSYSVGSNPRAMKRVLNAFQLQKIINQKHADLDSPRERLLLFAVLCLQLSYEELYRKLVENTEKFFNAEFFNKIKENVDVVGELLKEFEISGDDGVFGFIGCFANSLPKVKDGVITDEDIQRLDRLLRMAGTTSSDSSNLEMVYEVSADIEAINKTISMTDVKYKICTFGSKFHIGFGVPIYLKYNEKSYPCKTHKTAKGRVDGLSQFYKEQSIQVGEVFVAEYKYLERTIYLTKI